MPAPSTLRLLPPLLVEPAHIERAVGLIGESLLGLLRAGVRRKDNPRGAAGCAAASSTAERLAAIVEAAERAAVTVIDDAEKQAQRHLEQARAEADRSSPTASPRWST